MASEVVQSAEAIGMTLAVELCRHHPDKILAHVAASLVRVIAEDRFRGEQKDELMQLADSIPELLLAEPWEEYCEACDGAGSHGRLVCRTCGGDGMANDLGGCE